MKIGFIGGGNMAFAISSGVLKAGLCNADEIFVSDLNEAALEKYNEMGISTSTSNENVLNADFIVLAIKPFIYPTALAELNAKFTDKLGDKVFISIAAGVTIANVKKYLGFDAKVVRIMPNTPAMVLEGMSVIALEHSPASSDEFTSVEKIFKAIGKTEILSESLLNSVIAVSGSSPAYVYMMIEAMADAAVSDGIARDVAYRLAAQSVLGSARMVLETKIHPGELKDMVCSPRGTTIEAVKALEKNGFRHSIIEAMKKCTHKANNM